MKEKHNDSILIKALAIILITNSHLDHLYRFPILATGGSIGNSLFFFISGYGLHFSSSLKQPLLGYLEKRLRSIYLPFIIISLALFSSDITDGSSLFRVLVFPTEYWFIPAIALFYLLLYYFNRVTVYGKYTISFMLLIFAYAVYYLFFLDVSQWVIESTYIKWVYYFGVFLFGNYVASSKHSIGKVRNTLLLTSISFILYFGLKYYLLKSNDYYIQFLIHIINIGLVYGLYNFVQIPYINSIVNRPYSGRILVFLSGHTLYIYLLQTFTYNLAIVTKAPFVINVLIFIAIISVLAFLLKWMVTLLTKWIDKTSKKFQMGYK